MKLSEATKAEIIRRFELLNWEYFDKVTFILETFSNKEEHHGTHNY